MRTLYNIRRKVISLLLLFLPYSIYGEDAERIYLQTDKQLYIAGEPIWLKAYTTDTNGKLREFSKIGYAELLSDSKPEVQVLIEIKNGVGIGRMELPSTLGTGNYRLCGYTRYMRNEGEAVFFEKMITVINPLSKSDNSKEATETAESISDVAPQSNTVQLSVNKNRFEKREKGVITITGLPEEYASLAISVAGEVPFSHVNKSITDWKSNLRQSAGTNVDGPFLAEYEGAIFSGQLINNETNTTTSVQNATTILTFPGKELQIYSGQSVGNGVYNFYTQEITGKAELSTTVFPDKENIYRLDILSPFSSHSPKPFPSFYLDSIWRDYLTMRNLSSQVTRAYTTDSMSHFRPIVPHNVLTPFKQYRLNDFTRFSSVEETFSEFIYEARIRKVDGKRSFSLINDLKKGFSFIYVLVLLDNVPIVDHELICNYNVSLIEKIELYQGRHVYGNQVYGGIISFVTNKGDYPNIRFEDYTQMFDFEGTQPYRYFYSPDYEKRDNSTRMPDFRHTLLWEPLIDSKDGKSITVPFYTSDIPGKYDVRVEGISRDGKIINAVLQIEVAE